MKIREVLATKGRKIHRVEPSASIFDAIARMASHNIGSLMVIDESDEIVGIVSERDCLRVVATGADCREKPVSDIATRDIAIAELDDDLSQVLDTMEAKRCRHVPIVEDGELVGMISVRDVISARLRETRSELKFLREYITGPHGPPG
jgi:CBS domain-containing protein